MSSLPSPTYTPNYGRIVSTDSTMGADIGNIAFPPLESNGIWFVHSYATIYSTSVFHGTDWKAMVVFIDNFGNIYEPFKHLYCTIPTCNPRPLVFTYKDEFPRLLRDFVTTTYSATIRSGCYTFPLSNEMIDVIKTNKCYSSRTRFITTGYIDMSETSLLLQQAAKQTYEQHLRIKELELELKAR